MALANPALFDHRVRFSIYEEHLRVSQITYERKDIQRAIEAFLLGLPPQTKVMITRERAGAGRV